MKKKFLNGLLVFVILLVLPFGIARAASILKGFGGQIILNKAIEIQILESANYHCNVPGTSITIRPAGKSPTSYLIPAGIFSKTKNQIRPSQWIKGLYNQTKTPIVCVFQGTPPVEKTVLLPSIIMYGTSR